ncbi:Kinesin-like protein kif17 [Homalodisca vitripennis]|nr:Kinesin-like protein kif17 [Homalodisca vitripennis]
MAEAVKVIVRCRPMNSREIQMKSKNVVLMDSERCTCSLINPRDSSAPPKTFTFDGVYYINSTTEQIYNEIAYPLIISDLEIGYDTDNRLCQRLWMYSPRVESKVPPITTHQTWRQAGLHERLCRNVPRSWYARGNASEAARLYTQFVVRRGDPQPDTFPDHRMILRVHNVYLEERVPGEGADQRQTGTPKSVVHRILQQEDFHPYHIKKVHQLKKSPTAKCEKVHLPAGSKTISKKINSKHFQRLLVITTSDQLRREVRHVYLTPPLNFQSLLYSPVLIILLGLLLPPTDLVHIVQGVLEGYNSTVFAYGQTGCGKSFSMQGVESPPAQRGIIPRAFEHVFEAISLVEDVKYLVLASYLEIYNEEIRDLLGNDTKKRLDLKENPDRGVYVCELSHHTVACVADCQDLMERGWRNRSTGATLMNADSSRSHSILIERVCVCVVELSHHTVACVADCQDLMERGWRNRSTGATLMNADSSRSHSILIERVCVCVVELSHHTVACVADCQDLME